MRIRRFLRVKLLALAACSTLAALVLAELIVRLGGLAPELHRIRPDAIESAYQRSDNPVLGYEFKPDYRNLRPDLHESFPSTNAHGQRDVERRVEKPPGVTRVLMLGDSVVAGHGIFDVRDTIPLQLERLLKPRNVEVLNFGVGGYCTRAEAELLKVKGLQFQPDLVVVVFVMNDVVDVNSQVYHYRVRRPKAVEWMFVHSQLFRLASFRLDWFGFRSESDPDKQLRQNSDAIGSDNVSSGLSLLKRLSQEHDFDCLVAVWPGFDDKIVGDVELGSFRFLGAGNVAQGRFRSSGELMIERFAREHGIETVRLSDYFRADLVRRSEGGTRSPRDIYTIGDGMHPNAAGSATAAAALEKVVAHKIRTGP